MADPSHTDIERFVRDHDDPFVTTTDVAERFDSVSRRTVNQRLNDLHDEDRIGKRPVGPNGVVWFIPE